MPRSRSKYSEDAVLRRKNTIRDILLGVLIGLAVLFVIMAGRYIYEKSRNPDYRLADLFGITTAGTLPTLPEFPLDSFVFPSSSETETETAGSSEDPTEDTADDTAESPSESGTEETGETTVPDETSSPAVTETEPEPTPASTEMTTEENTEPSESSTEEPTTAESSSEETSPEDSTEETPSAEETTPEETTPEETDPEATTPEETTSEETTEETPILVDPTDINFHLAHFNMEEQDLGGCSQLIVVHSSGTQCMLYFFDKGEKEWAQSNAIASAPGIVGENGVTTDKKEGDGCTPAGYFALGPCYGEDAVSPTAMEYHQIVDGDYWVDDVSSRYYNTFVHVDVFDSRIGWNTGEDMFNMLRYYRHMAVIRYNTDPVIPGAGSAVFLRCQADDTATSGSVGTKDATVFAILRWLDPEADPHILIY